MNSVTLADFLRATGSKRFAWGSCDCCTWACEWVMAFRGVDPAARWRGKYKTERGAAGWIKRGGGSLEAIVAEAMTKAGLVPTNTPIAGDVGLLKTRVGPTLAVRCDRGWASIGLRGLVVVSRAQVLRAWAV